MPPSKGNSNNWVLCPSTTFPGKFYYFNVESGETAWSNDNKPNAKKNYNPNINQHYPEPCTFPPNYPNLSTRTNPKISINQHVNTPVFGQSSFPKYVPNVGPYMPNMLWSLVPMPMIINQPLYSSDHEKQMLNNATQTSSEHSTVHTCKLPLSERFAANVSTQWELNTNSETNDYDDDSYQKNLCSNKQSSDRDLNTDVRLKHPSDRSWDSSVSCRSTLNQGPYKRIRTESESTNSHLPNSLCKSRSLQCLTDNLYESKHARPLKDQNGMSVNESSSHIGAGIRISATDFEPPHVLDENDLRYKLVAKRRKSVDIDTLENRMSKPVDIENRCEFKSGENGKGDEINTLNFFEDSCRIDEDDMTSPTQNLIETLRNMAKRNDKSVWYIVTDKDVLLEHCDLIEQFVRQDNSCRMVIPYVTMSEMKQIGLGDSRGRQLAVAARHVIRRLVTAPAHVIVQPNDNLDFQVSSCDKIIQCCMQAMSQGFHVVLVTNNEELIKKSKCNDINTITVKEIQNGRLLDESYEQIKKIQISVENKPMENLFMQSPSNFEPSLNFENRTDISVNCFKKNLFETKNVDTSTSPIDFEEMKNITQPKINASFSYDNNIEKTASEIGQSINPIRLNEELKVLRTFDFRNEKKNPCKLNVASSMVKPRSLEAFVDMELKSLFMNGSPEERLGSRIDECYCIFTQIMEEALFEVIKVSQPLRMAGILCLRDAVIRIGDVYNYYPVIKSYVEKLSTSLERWGKPKHKSLIANEFFKMFRCGVLFIQELRTLLPNMHALTDATEALLDLLKRIQDPENDEILQLETPSAQINRSELVSVQPRHNFIKKSADIIEYLKQNFPAWKTYDDNETRASINNNTNVIRTTGANLSKLTLRVTKPTSHTKPPNHTNIQTTEQTNHRVDNALKKITNDTIEQKTHGIFEKFQVNLSHDTSNYDNKNGFDKEKKGKEQKTNRAFSIDNNGPRVIRNVKLLNSFEDRLKKESESSRDSGIIQEESSFNVNSLGGSKDSCFGSGAEEVCCLARTFLVTISVTLKKIYQFVQKTIKEIRKGGGLNEKSNNTILIKTNGVLAELNNIIELLKCIAERESQQRTEFKSLVLQNADSMCDKRLKNYGRVVAKCLEQASILRSVLNIVSSMNDDATDISQSVTTDMSYINVFE